MTRTQLGLVDAAHILPVEVPGSTDNVHNGLALAPTIHRAFDSMLIYLSEDYRMLLNKDRANELSAQGLAGGLAALRRHLGPIRLPANRALYPDPRMIRRANAFRERIGR